MEGVLSGQITIFRIKHDSDMRTDQKVLSHLPLQLVQCRGSHTFNLDTFDKTLYTTH
jgi:hypothetical protein